MHRIHKFALKQIARKHDLPFEGIYARARFANEKATGGDFYELPA